MQFSADSRTKTISSAFPRVAKYTITKAIILFLTVVVAVYLTILVANMGGYVDEIIRARITEGIAYMIMGGWLKDVPTEEKFEIVEQTQWAMEEAAGLHQPFVMRCFREATLAFLGVSDPVLPTWGKLIVDGLSSGVHSGAYHLVLEPLCLLLLVGLAFVMLGLALEWIFDPRLRGV